MIGPGVFQKSPVQLWDLGNRGAQVMRSNRERSNRNPGQVRQPLAQNVRLYTIGNDVPQMFYKEIT